MDNHALNKLLRKIHTLEKSKKVKVDTVFRKPPKLFDFTYIKQNDFSSHIAVIARLTFMADKYVDSINIYCSQPNSIFTFVEFEIKLKNSFFTNNDVEIFLNSGIDHVTKDDYFNYIDSHSLKEQLYYSMIQQFAYDLLNLCLQRYITHFCYSKNGKKGFLYSLSSYCQPEEVVLDKINTSILSSVSILCENK